MRAAFTLYFAFALVLSAATARPEENYASWEVLTNPFSSTGGGGIMIDGYKPVIRDGKCLTDFTATVPDDKTYYNTVEYEAIEVQGGILCANGKWRAKDGSASGTTTFRMFIKDGVVHRAP